MTTYFIAVQSPGGGGKGDRADGYLVANGDAYVARSGGYRRGEIPAGSYEIGKKGEHLNPKKKQNRSMAKAGSDWRQFRKFRISGVGPTSAGPGLIRDARWKTPRDGVMLHFDGNGPGSEGCIAYDDPRAQTSIENALAANDRKLEVIYVESDEEAHAMATRLAGGEAPPRNTIRGYGQAGASESSPVRGGGSRPKRRKRTAQLGGDVSTIQSGARMAQGEPTVLLGEKQLMAAHVQARHTGGGRIREGSPTVFVGKQQLAFGRVTDPTTDGSHVATGEPSVMVG